MWVLNRLSRSKPSRLTGAFDRLVRPAVVGDTARRLAGPQGRVETWPERHDRCRVAHIKEIASGLNLGP